MVPGNEGRGYVLRRLMRRVIRNMRLLGADQPCMQQLVTSTVVAMAPQYPELVREQPRIEAVAAAEETTFLQTLKTGASVFRPGGGRHQKAGGQQLSGDRAFVLHDTHGFPIELTLEMAAEQASTSTRPGSGGSWGAA